MTPLETETLLETRRYSVERRIYERSPIGRYDRHVVVHPGAVAIVPFISDNELVMIHQLRHSIGQEIIELPAGTREPGEAPEACARRELEEETGFRAGSMQELCTFYTTPGFSTEFMHVFLARDLEQTAPKLEGSEQIRTEQMGVECAVQMIATGRIIDAKTIAALLVYRLREGC